MDQYLFNKTLKFQAILSHGSCITVDSKTTIMPTKISTHHILILESLPKLNHKILSLQEKGNKSREDEPAWMESLEGRLERMREAGVPAGGSRAPVVRGSAIAGGRSGAIGQTGGGMGES
jgi:hypothetical protein